METRELWWNVSEYPLSKEFFYFFFYIAIFFFIYGFYLKIKTWLQGKPVNDFKNIPARLLNMLLKTFLHAGWNKNRKFFSMIAHMLIFYGFFALWIGTDILTVQDKMPEYFFQGVFYKYYSLIMDLAGVLLLVGTIYYTYIRYIKKPQRIDNYQNDWIQLIFLAAFVIVGFLIEGLRQSSTNQIEQYAPVGAFIAQCFNHFSPESKKVLHLVFWWSHAMQTFLFIGLIPFTKFSHIFIAPANIFFSDLKQTGKLPTPFNLIHILAMDNPPDDFTNTVSKIKDFTWKDLMDLDACTSCGRCQEVCPATNTDKPLSPKFVILDLKQTMYHSPLFSHKYGSQNNKEYDSKRTLAEIISPQTLWSCTTCNACVEVCPIGINQLTKIVELRRVLIHENKAPNNLLNTLKNIRSRSNPWGQPPEDREKWTEGLEMPKIGEIDNFEYLYWVGCAGAYDSRNQNIAKTMVKLLKKAEVKFVILGKKEKCTGDTARRAGDEGLFQELAIENIETFKQYNIKKIITHCPHCFNTFKNEYPEFGLKNVQIYHHTEILWKLITEGKLSMTKEINEQITYHDSCYLGRHNGQYDMPRNILNKIPGMKYTEMKNSKESGTCCGGGGAQLWYEAPGKQINVMRLNEINKSDVDVAVTACPFCTIMLETARTLAPESKILIQDISEIVDKATS